MGLFDFVSAAGRKLGIDYFEKEEELKKLDNEAERLKQEAALREQMSAELTKTVVDLNLGIEGFRARVLARGRARLSGVATSQAAKEKAILTVGNAEGISQVEDDDLTVSVPEPPAVFHTVVKGDTLSLIAKHYYGIIMAYPEIGDANQPPVENVDKISPGWVLRIPPIEGILYTSKKGDTLSGIAKTMYGDLKLYPEIFEANTDVLTNPDVLKPDTQLFIPIRHPLPGAVAPNS